MGRVKWNRSEGGFVSSKEGRFLIGAKCAGGTRPEWYEVLDRVANKKHSGQTQKECKEWAESIVEVEENPPNIPRYGKEEGEKP